MQYILRELLAVDLAYLQPLSPHNVQVGMVGSKNSAGPLKQLVYGMTGGVNYSYVVFTTKEQSKIR